MIWCVEDDASIRDIEVYALNSTGLEAKGVEDGDTCWELLRHETPELILLDVMLPGLDGVPQGDGGALRYTRHYGHGKGRGIR